MALYFWMWPVAVPTMIGDTDGLLSECGVSSERYRLMASVSAIGVSKVGIGVRPR